MSNSKLAVKGRDLVLTLKHRKLLFVLLFFCFLFAVPTSDTQAAGNQCGHISTESIDRKMGKGFGRVQIPL